MHNEKAFRQNLLRVLQGLQKINNQCGIPPKKMPLRSRKFGHKERIADFHARIPHYLAALKRGKPADVGRVAYAIGTMAGIAITISDYEGKMIPPTGNGNHSRGAAATKFF